MYIKCVLTGILAILAGQHQIISLIFIFKIFLKTCCVCEREWMSLWTRYCFVCCFTEISILNCEIKIKIDREREKGRTFGWYTWVSWKKTTKEKRKRKRKIFSARAPRKQIRFGCTATRLSRPLFVGLLLLLLFLLLLLNRLDVRLACCSVYIHTRTCERQEVLLRY